MRTTVKKTGGRFDYLSNEVSKLQTNTDNRLGQNVTSIQINGIDNFIQAGSTSSVVNGNNNSIACVNSSINGTGNTVSVKNSILIGNDNSINGDNVIALGVSGLTGYSNSTYIGSPSIYLGDVNSVIYVNGDNKNVLYNLWSTGISGESSLKTIGNRYTEASADYAMATGTYANASHYAEIARSSSNLGQYGTVSWAGYSTNDSAKELNLGNGDKFTLTSGDTYFFEVKAIASNPSTGNAKQWTASALIKNISGTTSIVGIPIVTSDYADSELSGTGISLLANDTDDTLKVSVTGNTSTHINWFVKGDYIKVNKSNIADS